MFTLLYHVIYYFHVYLNSNKLKLKHVRVSFYLATISHMLKKIFIGHVRTFYIILDIACIKFVHMVLVC